MTETIELLRIIFYLFGAIIVGVLVIVILRLLLELIKDVEEFNHLTKRLKPNIKMERGK